MTTTETQPCSQCGGYGWVYSQVVLQRYRFEIHKAHCDKCNGTGRTKT